MRRIRVKRNDDGTFNLNIDLTEIDLKCLWHRFNQSKEYFLKSYDELTLDGEIAELKKEEFMVIDDWFIWNAIDEILCDQDMQEYDSNNEEIEEGN